ncbi:MAG: phosphonoacetaldehyde hydrolase [Planctomycetota bacterium]|jgi:phosphonoacetaldehyde hydrolase
MDSVSQKNYQGLLKAVILDWAGTTMDYGCYAPAVVFIEVYKRHGVDITMQEARQPMGAHKKVHIRKISQIPTVAQKWQATHTRQCTEDDVEKMFAEFIPLQLACLGDYADLIPGTVEAVDKFRSRGLKIGSTTGYMREMMDLLLEEAKRRGYEPDSTVCAADVPAGRPEPWMCFRNAENLGVYPTEVIVKIGDTLPDIYEGLNAGMWTIGLAKTGNELGLNEKEIEALPDDELEQRLQTAYKRMHEAGAHYVVDGIWDCDKILDDINARLERGEKPARTS